MSVGAPYAGGRKLSPRTWGLLGLAAAVAFGLLVVLTGRLDEAGSWQLEIDRATALDQTRALGQDYDLDLGSWKVQAWAAHEPRAVRSPVVFNVELQEPDGIGSFKSSFAADGRLRFLEVKPSRSGRVLEPEESRRLAQEQLERLVGPETAAGFELFFQDQPMKGLNRYRWSGGDAAAPTVAEADLRGDRVERLAFKTREAREESTSGDEAEESEEPDLDDLFSMQLEDAGTVVLVLALLIYLAQGLFFRQPYRIALRFGALVALLELIRVTLIADSLSGRDGTLELLLNPILFHGLLGAILLGAGLVAARRATLSLLMPFEELLRGRLWTGTVAGSVGFGLLAGMATAALPAVAALVGSWLDPGARLLRTLEGDLGPLASPWPALMPILPWLPLAVVAQFAFVVPLFHGIARRPWVARALAVPVGTVLFAGELVAAESLGLRLAAGLLLALALDQIHHRAGLLAVLAAGVGLTGARALASLAVQPGPLGTGGWLGAVGLLGLGALFAVASFRPGRSLVEPRELYVPRRLRAQRERIKAQLSVARQAQMRMLPPRPPELPGLAIAAACRPAREVGGDLYDFIPLPDGRWAIAVGDVSGKGMVASLYMTLTKGLLLAAAEHRGSARETLSEVNRGLHRQCDSSTFVTLWYGILDPRTRTLTHLRAGHNPPYLRRARSAENVLLRPPGLGLGLAASSIFDSVAKEETLHFEPGDALIVYSDGLPEAMDGDRQEYGDDRLAAAVARTDGLTAEQARDAILADVTAFMGHAPQHDDMTLVVVRFDQAVAA